MSFDDLKDLAPLFNGIAGVASLVLTCVLWPTVKSLGSAVQSLRDIATRLDQRADDHGERISRLEGRAE